MHRSLLQYLDGILDSGERIQNYSQGVTFQEFSSDPMMMDAVIRNVEITGEAVKQVPPDLKARYPESDWKRIAGFRDILSYTFFSISPATIWDTGTYMPPDVPLDDITCNRMGHWKEPSPCIRFDYQGFIA